MPGTDEELVALAANWPTEDPDALRWADGTAVSRAERNCLDYLATSLLHIRGARKREPQRAAMRLLRSLLTPAQAEQLRKSKCFLVTAASGHTYRLWPRCGHAERVTKHGGRYFAAMRFCYHEEYAGEADAIPRADRTIGHLLAIVADERAFLQEANATNVRDQLWNGDYLRRMRARPRDLTANL